MPDDAPLDLTQSVTPFGGTALLEPPPLSTGATLGGRFTILRRLGEGGTGTVYAARDGLLAEDVALKVLHRASDSEDVSLRRLRDEVRAARRIAHPNVCRVHDLGEMDGRVFVVMELLPGVTLRDRLRSTGGAAESLEILRQLAAGLGAAHRAGVIHCDVKPENALLAAEEGGRTRVALTDFGIARLVGPSLAARENNVEGTPAYMAPEQLLGLELDERTDVFALAVIACELLLGAHPYGVTPSSTFLSLSQKVINEGPQFPSRRPVGLDEVAHAALLKALRRGLAREPEDRFDGVDALVSALVAACGHVGGARPAAPAPTPPSLSEDRELHTPPRHTPPTRKALSTAGKGARRLCTIAHVVVEPVAGGAGDEDDGSIERVESMLDVAEAALGDAGGALVSRLPRAVVAVFGARSAQGDEPQRAVDAARAVVGAAGPDLAVRAAVDTGRLLVRLGPTGALNVAGDALSRAAVLASQIGARGEVRATERAARHLARRFTLAPGVGWSRVVARRPAAAAEVRGAPLLGREPELGRLVETLAGAARRACGALLLGPPGMGKSRLRREVGAALASRGFLPLVAGATPDDVLEPHAVLRTLLRQLLGLSEAPTATEAGAAARRGLRVGSDEPEPALVAALAGLVGPRVDIALVGGRTVGLPGASVVAAAARSALTVAARVRPLLVVVEDAGWADDATLDLLESVARGELEAPIAVLLEGLPDLPARRPRAVDKHVLRVDLGPLEPARAVELAALCLGDDATPEAARAVAEAAEGNPFHIEEMARDLVERGGAAGALPTTVEESIQARLDRLDFEARDTLRAAAVLGQTFRRTELDDLLEAAGGGGASGRSLDELEARRIVKALPPDAMCDDRYVIQHGLIRDVAYRELAPVTRRGLHAAAARLLRAARLDTLEDGGRGEAGVERLAELARHLEGADERAEAQAVYERAGELALAQGAPVESLRCLRRARLLAGEPPPLELLLALGTAALDAGEVAEAETALDTVIAVCEPVARARPLLARALLARSHLAKQRGRWDETAAFARRGLAEVGDGDDPVLAASLHGALGWVLGYIQGDGQTGLAECLLAVELLAGTEHLAELGHAYSALGATYMRVGRWRDQLRCNRKNLEIGEKLGSLELCARAHLNLSVNLQSLGETDEAIAHARTALALRQRMCAPTGIGLARNNLAIALVDAGRLDEAEAEAREAIRLSELGGGLYYRYECESSLARVEARRGKLAAALSHAEAGLAIALRDGGKVDEGIARKLVGAVMSMAGRHDEARAVLAEAGRILEATDPGEAARVVAETARAELRAGDAEAARRLVEEATRRLRGLGAALDEANVANVAWI